MTTRKIDCEYLSRLARTTRRQYERSIACDDANEAAKRAGRPIDTACIRRGTKHVRGLKRWLDAIDAQGPGMWDACDVDRPLYRYPTGEQYLR